MEKASRNPETTAVASVKITRVKTRNLIILSSSFYLLSVIFLILTEIGNLNDKPVLRSGYFLKINVADILPSTSASDAILVNSIARSLGIYDFYQVGLWNFCGGYNDEGISHCSKPQNLYWFDPVQIIRSELLAGATIRLPSKITTILTLIRIVSELMFGFFMLGLCMNFVSIFLSPIVLHSRWYSYHYVTLAFISALLTFAGSTIATVMYVIFQKVITSQKELNISAGLGVQMFVFMWMGTVFSMAGWILHFYMACVSRKAHHSGEMHRVAVHNLGIEERISGFRQRADLSRVEKWGF